MVLAHKSSHIWAGRMKFVVSPASWIVNDVVADVVEGVFVSNDMFVIVAMPERMPGCTV
jgi:hypothetical protein